jgi:plastocyanin
LSKRISAALVAAAALLALAAPSSALARKVDAWAGSPGKAPAGTPKGTELNMFFPATLRIRQGDSVRFRNNEFHTVTFLGRGQKAPPLFVPAPGGATYNGFNDASNNPFYFNAKPKFIYNTNGVFGPVGNSTIGDGKLHSTGAFGKPVGRASATFKFPKRGTYTVMCLLHPGMKGRVIVGKRSSRVPNAADLQATVAREAVRGYTSARKAVTHRPPANTIYAGIGDKATVFAFLPNKLTVKAGTTVDVIERSSSEVHNMVFGPKDYVEKFAKDTDLIPTGPGSPNQLTPVLIYGTDPPGAGGGYTYDGASHGNGFFVTPVIDDSSATPIGNTSRVTFTKAGTYHYFCAIHGPEMAGDVVVTE